MVWAQIFPFVALTYYEGPDKEILSTFLWSSLGLWLLLNTAFFCSIDLKFIGTFFGIRTATQYTVDIYRTSKEDFQRFDAVFTTRLEFTQSIHDDVKEWVANNIERWMREEPDWFTLEVRRRAKPGEERGDEPFEHP